jgi:signal transduction histidine kinase/ActR/RegA family two-component response regulator
MLISTLKKRLNNISVSGRLYLLISLITLATLIGYGTLLFSDKSSFLIALSSFTGAMVLVLCFVLVKHIKGIFDAPEKINEGQSSSSQEMVETLRIQDLSLQMAEQKIIRERRKREASEKAKQIFLVNISHEIRTPMNGVLGFAKLLEESLVNEDERESLQMIIKSADQLMAILNDILDFSRLESGDINFVNQPFVLKDTVRSIYRLMEPAAALKELKFSYLIPEDMPIVLSGDAVRLGQILLNLTSNAIKFTEQGEVRISLHLVEKLADTVTVEFQVKDTGIGIPADKHQKVFDFFEQVTNDTSRRYAGTGLGLSIVKRLVELQGGEVFLDSIVGTGSDFYFRLTFARVTEHVSRKTLQLLSVLPDIPVETGKGVRILVVEDNPINQLLVLKLLEKRGYETTVAENGKIAIDEYRKGDFDIILMDLQMPELDGYEATRVIRMMEGHKGEIPIVAMTAHTIKGELEKCADIGMNDYISKPFDATELYQKIEMLVGSTAGGL